MTTTDEIRAKVAAETCSCKPCGSCEGIGSYFVDIGGRYIGLHRIDDLSDRETCEECGGSGIEEVCGRCEYLAELDDGTPGGGA